MLLSTQFLGWEQPLLSSAVEKLLGNRNVDLINLSNIMVVIPTSHSAQKFRYHLAKLLSKENKGLVPPKTVTPEYFISTNSTQKQKATYSESLLAWLSVFETFNIEELNRLFPNLPAPENRHLWNINVIDSIINLTNTIAEAGHTISTIVENHQEVIVDDIDRWLDLLKLENEYIKTLNANDLIDPNSNKIISANSPSVPYEINRIIIIGIIDPIPIVINSWKILSKQISTEVWIHAPESEKNSFDKWGRPLEKIWSNREIDIPFFENNVHIASPENMHHNISTILSNLRDDESNDIDLNKTSIFTANNSLIPYIKSFFIKHEIRTSDPAGDEYKTSKLYILLDNFYNFLTSKNYKNFAALLRTPDILNYFRYYNDNFDIALLLTSLDQLQNKYLPETVDDIGSMINSESKNSSKYSINIELLKIVYDHFLNFLEKTEAKSLHNFLHFFIENIYSGKKFKNDNMNDNYFIETLTTFNKILNEFNESQIKTDHLSILKQFNILLNILSREKTYPDSKIEGALEIDEWLKTEWSDSENIILTGMNDKYLPGGVHADIFLPNSIKQKLGIRDIDSRFGRDSYILTALLKSHSPGKIHFIVNNIDTSGDPLKPSRLLFLTNGKNLISRLKKLFIHRDEDGRSSSINDYSASFKLKPAKKNIEPVLYATDFSNYLSSPFIFYLKKALKMEKIDDRKNDIDPRYFGDTCHTILQKFSEKEDLNKIKSLDKLQNILKEYVDREIILRYGHNLSLPSIISTASIKQRIIKSAEQIFNDYKSGWRIIEVEKSFSLNIDNNFVTKWSKKSIKLSEPYIIRGKIDRIDRNIKTGKIRIVDYKTSEKGKEPDKFHYKKPRDIAKLPEYSRFTLKKKSYAWLDLQLPIYYLMLENSEIETDGNLYCCYFNLPKIISETGILYWDNIGDFIPAACSAIADIVININQKVFWPPYNLTGFNDTYNEFLFNSPNESIDTDYMLNFMDNE